jgi:hypothetical protein
LNQRLVRLVEDLASQPHQSIPQACATWAATKAAYRFWDNDRVKAEAIRSAHQLSTVERIAQQSMVLAIQDTTDLDFTHHSATKGMGYLEQPQMRGVKVHSVFGVSPEGVPLGLIHQQVWARPLEQLGQKHQRRKRSTEQKESQRWLSAQQATEEAIDKAVGILTIADREADIFDFLAQPRRADSHLLIRATHNRRVIQETPYLLPNMRQTPICAQITLELARNPQRPARLARLSVRFKTLEIAPPRHHRQRSQYQPIRVQVILAEEEEPPVGEPAVSWLLLSTLPVESVEQAMQCLRWYSLRWLIERYHYVLKSGCRIEQLQLETKERIERALATYSIVAWRLLWLTYQARQHPEQSCETVLQADEWQALACRMLKTRKPPTKSPSLRQAVRWIAQLGGFLARKGDGEPGVKTLWRGLARLHDIAEMWKLLAQNPHPPKGSRLMGNA